MNFLFFSTPKVDAGKARASSASIPENVNLHRHEVNKTDGGEFLDDAIRMKDQPLVYTEVSRKDNAGKLTRVKQLSII